jgi:hypothetical protein
MPAYILVDCEVTDPVRYDAYKALAPAAIARYGGRYLVRGGEMVKLEGDWTPVASSCSSSRPSRLRGPSTIRPSIARRAKRGVARRT